MKKLAALILIIIAITCVYSLMDSEREVIIDDENGRVIIIERQVEEEIQDETGDDSSYLLEDESIKTSNRNLKLISQMLLVAFELLMYG